MIEQFFKSRARIQSFRSGLGGPFFETFAKELFKERYAKMTARQHLRAAEHFLYWTNQEGIPISDLTEKLLEPFERHLDKCQCPRFGHSKRLHLLNGVRLFFKHLRNTGTLTGAVAEPSEQNQILFTEFCQWMRQQRGTNDLTLYNYGLFIRDLLKVFGENPARFEAHSLRQFVLEKSQKSGWAAAKTCTTALRMFLRFLIAEGKCTVGLDAAIPTLAHWRLSSLPRYVEPEEVERIINCCNLNSAVGRRDRAILLLLARMGLRAGDIVRLNLGDIDWERAWLCVSGKGRRQARLPLTQEVGDAIVDYLQNGRPQTDTDILFIRSRASHCAISVIVKQAMRRANVTCHSRGAAHVLRHSAATAMLRQGVSLHEIAAILRHRSTETTEIYAKVDVTTLRKIAQPWPEVQQC